MLIIVHLSLQSCFIPDIWKHAFVVPVFKKSHLELHAINYRPISHKRRLHVKLKPKQNQNKTKTKPKLKTNVPTSQTVLKQNQNKTKTILKLF